METKGRAICAIFWRFVFPKLIVCSFVFSSLCTLYAVYQRDQDEENGLTHDLAGSIRKMVESGGASVFGSTIATDDVTTASPDFVSLDGSAPTQEIEMESPPSSPTPESTYAM